MSNDATNLRPIPPSTSRSQRDLILERLRQAGQRGVLAAELYDDPQCRYGRSPRNRIAELRAMGHKITGVWEGRINFRYTLTEETPAPKSLPDYNTQGKIDWPKRETGYNKPRPHPSAGPLFNGMEAGS